MNEPKPIRPEPGDRVTQRHVPGTRHGEVEAVHRPVLLVDPTEVVVRWNDGGSKVYDERRLVSQGFGTWMLRPW